MKKELSLLYIMALVILLSGCSIFKPGCKCPKVVSTHSSTLTKGTRG